jgi:SAM-dependent methyltransferase
MSEYETEYVHNVYNEIAYEFSHSRNNPFPDISYFFNNLPRYSLIGDIGCGNGKYHKLINSHYMIGCDYSIELLKQSTNNMEVVNGDNLRLPYRNNIFDAIISMSVIHHFVTEERRLSALTELLRVVKPNGLIMCHVWSYEKYKTQLEQDRLILWKNKYKRYYHLFKQGELNKLICKIDNCIIIDSYNEHQNWVCIVKKLQ